MINWEIVVTVLLSVFTIYASDYMERRRKSKEELKFSKSEKELFRENLKILKSNISIQVNFLDEYIKSTTYKMFINPAIQVNFLRTTNIKSIYSSDKNGEILENGEMINELISALYSISQFNESLIATYKEFVESYSRYENIFRENYKEVFYNKCYEISNQNKKGFNQNGDIIFDDPFVKEYFSISNSFNQEVLNEEGKIDRGKIDIQLKELIKISGKNIFKSRGREAIMVNNIANKAHNAYVEMKNIEEKHLIEIESYKKLLQNSVKIIDSYLIEENK
jgi:hypothetical protein